MKGKERGSLERSREFSFCLDRAIDFQIQKCQHHSFLAKISLPSSTNGGSLPLSSQRLFLNIALNSNCLLLSISSLPELASHHPSAVIFLIFLCEEITDFFSIFNQNSLILLKNQRTCNSGFSKEPHRTGYFHDISSVGQTRVSIMVSTMISKLYQSGITFPNTPLISLYQFLFLLPQANGCTCVDFGYTHPIDGLF